MKAGKGIRYEPGHFSKLAAERGVDVYSPGEED